MLQNVDSSGCAGVDGECASGPGEPNAYIDDRLARMESERTMLRRELIHRQEQVADMEARLTRFQPVLEAGSLVLSGLRSAAMLPLRAVKALAAVPALAKRLM